MLVKGNSNKAHADGRSYLAPLMATFATRKLTKMADYGEWNQKGATRSDVTAKKEYNVDREFIIKGIEAGKLEYREGAMWGNPYLRILRSQLEKYIADKLGKKYLLEVKNQAELKKIKREMTALNKKLKALQARKIEIEKTRNK